jgi:hypothetical protein
MKYKQQTAVDWLQEQLECFGDNQELQMPWTTLDELFEQAKEMEKQQIIDAMDVTQRTDFYVKYEGSEQYYNETFGGKDEQ